jgi:hypothetical protein
MKKLIQKIIKYKKVSVTTIYVDPIIGIEWILFGRFRIFKTYKSS